jgi:hypothetical protein
VTDWVMSGMDGSTLLKLEKRQPAVVRVERLAPTGKGICKERPEFVQQFWKELCLGAQGHPGIGAKPTRCRDADSLRTGSNSAAGGKWFLVGEG